MSPSVAITIVTYNSSRYIARCLEAALAQNYRPLEVIVVDNASSDGTPAILSRFSGRCIIVCNAVNTGFAAAQNQAIAMSDSSWVLCLNPDVLLSPDFVRDLVKAGETEQRIGTVCGKLLAMTPDFGPTPNRLLDSTGIFLTPELRHLDRGSRMPDDGTYDEFEYVFGATGAAALYRRAMIEDVSVNGEFFDTDFFAYREDADVAWRAQILGWTCLYVPVAVAHHVRSVLPENRRDVPAFINMHSVKNRWLLRIKNMTAGLYRRHFLAITTRDLVVIGGCLLREHRSLPGFVFVLRNWRRTIEKRRKIMARRRASDAYLVQWLSRQPVSLPAPDVARHFAVRASTE